MMTSRQSIMNLLTFSTPPRRPREQTAKHATTTTTIQNVIGSGWASISLKTPDTPAGSRPTNWPDAMRKK